MNEGIEREIKCEDEHGARVLSCGGRRSNRRQVQGDEEERTSGHVSGTCVIK